MSPGKPDHRSCGWHYSYTSVNADGSVLPCCGLYDQKFDFGRVTAEPGSFGKLWRNQNFETVRRDFPAGTETKAEGPTTACTRCARSERFLDHYQFHDREIMMKYWSCGAASDIRRLDDFFTLLQRSPSQFAAAFAGYYNDRAAREPACLEEGVA